jgi:alkylhydroperoxidase family enzyme
LAEFFNETLGFCPNSVLTMQRRPAISKAFINLNKAVMANEGRVTSALKRMIAWVSSNATGCRYCQAHAIRAAERQAVKKPSFLSKSQVSSFHTFVLSRAKF